MTIHLPNDIAEALKKRAEQEGLHAQFLLLNLLQRSLGLSVVDYRPRDAWEQRLYDGAKDYGVSIPDKALSSDGLYD